MSSYFIIIVIRAGYKGAVFGSSEVNVESWRCVKRLTAHQSDVVDIAWSPDGQYLASCGLDGYVVVWDAETFGKNAVLL